jgi:hypothetical protein
VEINDPAMTEDAIKHYHSLLDGSLADDAVEKLSDGTVRYNLTFGERPICTALRPMFIAAEQYDYVKRDSTLTLAAIEKLYRALMADEKLRAEMGLSPEEEQLVAIDPGFSAPDASGRLDAFWDSRGDFHFVEYNADSPGGLLYGDALSEIFMEMALVREFARDYPLRRIGIKPRILQTLLDDPAYEHLFSTDEIAALRRHVPWTRVLREGFMTYRDRRVDLVDFVSSRRNDLVLKPNGDYGGRGVVLGWQCSDEYWRQAVEEALGASFVAQERVEVLQQSFPTLADNKVVFEDRYIDFDPYTWSGDDVEGAGVRLSPSALLNVTAGGGSATPMLIIG